MGGRGSGASRTQGASRKGFSEESLNKHYAKHSKEFAGLSKDEYAERAVEFRDKLPSVEIEEFTDANCSVYKFNSHTNEFMVYKENGEIITYFIPDNPSEYWMRQKAMYE
jgi:pyocin large subunit-like protein